MILYFSATGNSRHVAMKLSELIGDKAVSIEGLPSDIAVADGERLGIVSPTAWWELPVMMRQFLRTLTISGKPSYVFFVATYGTISGAIAADAAHELKRRGIHLDAAFGVRMPDTWTPIFNLSDQDKVAKMNADADIQIESLAPRISACEKGVHIEWNMPYAVRLFTDPLLDIERHTRNFHLEDTCIGCGLCARNCPAIAIEMRDKHPVWIKDMCALCFRCLHSCPKFAIQYGRNTKAHGQYLHPSISKGKINAAGSIAALDINDNLSA